MKKFLLMFIICISSFMIYTNNVKALTQSAVLGSEGYNFFNINDNQMYQNLYPDYTLFSGLGEGTVIFSILTSNSGQPVDQIRDVYIYSNPNIFTCNLGTVNSYIDSTQQRVLYTVQCSVNFPTGKGINYIRFNRPDHYGVLKINYSTYITFISKDSAVDVSSIVNAINSQTSSLISNNNSNTTSIINSIDSVYSSINSILSSVNDIDTKLDNIKNNANATASNTEEIKNDIKNDNVSGAEGSADDLKNNSAFQDNSGLSGVISMPLTFVNSLTNACEPINLTIPYMDVDLTIPCMQSLITNKMPLLANLIKIVVNGFIVYRILLDIFQIVRNAKNPEDDRIEVLDL